MAVETRIWRCKPRANTRRFNTSSSSSSPPSSPPPSPSSSPSSSSPPPPPSPSPSPSFSFSRFRIHPPEELDRVHKEILSLFNIFSVNPVFGVDYHEEEASPDLDHLKVARVDDNVEIVDTGSSDAFAAYYADGAAAEEGEREIAFDEEIGLACEALPEGYTMSNLWAVASD